MAPTASTYSWPSCEREFAPDPPLPARAVDLPTAVNAYQHSPLLILGDAHFPSFIYPKHVAIAAVPEEPCDLKRARVA